MTNVFSKPEWTRLGPLQYTRTDSQCFWNAMINQGRLTKMGIKCRIVCGSLYYGRDVIYGGLSNTTLKQWARDFSISHCWVEDEEGGIYDYIYSSHGTNIKFAGEIIGWTQRDLSDLYDIHYYPAPKKCQTAIWAHWDGEIDFRIGQNKNLITNRCLTRDDFINTEHVWEFNAAKSEAHLRMTTRPVFATV